jgi:hypothetical protein
MNMDPFQPPPLPLVTVLLRFLEEATNCSVRPSFDVVRKTHRQFMGANEPATSFRSMGPHLLVARRCETFPVWWVALLQSYNTRKPRPGQPKYPSLRFEGYAVEVEGGQRLQLLHSIPEKSLFLEMAYNQFVQANRQVWGPGGRQIDQSVADLVLNALELEFQIREPPYLEEVRERVHRLVSGAQGEDDGPATLLVLKNDPEVWRIPGMDNAVSEFLRDPDGTSSPLFLDLVMTRL